MSEITASRPEVVNGTLSAPPQSATFWLYKRVHCANRHTYPASSERYQLTDIDEKMLLSGLVLSRWCEYYLMQEACRGR